MTRSGLIAGLMVLLGAGCATERCPDAPGAGRDACLAEVARQLELTDPAAAEARVREMSPGEARDLAWLQLARATGRPVCGEVGDPALKAHCLDLVGRLHLREGPRSAPPPASAPAAGPPRPACPNGAPGDRCVQSAVDAAAPADRPGLCGHLTDPDRRGECRARAVEDLAAAGDLRAARTACGAEPDAHWRDECWFRVAERADGAALADRMGLCAKAGGYRDQCEVHLVERVSAAAVERAAAGSFLELHASLVAGDAELRSAAPRAGTEAERQRALYWFQGWRHALSRVPELGVSRGWDTTLADPMELQTFFDARARIWLRREGADLGAALAPLPAEDRLPAAQRALDAALSAVPPRPPTEAPFGAAIAPEAETGRLATLGRVPEALDPELACPDLAEVRPRVVLLWAAAVREPELALPLLQAGLADPSATVRATALSLIQERVFEHDRGGELGHAGLREAVEARATAEPLGPLRRYAAALVAAMAAREGRQLPPLDLREVCGLAPGAAPAPGAPTR